VILHAENGVLGYGRMVSEENEIDPDIYNAAGQFVALNPGASFFDSVTSFEMARGGRIDTVILGAYEVDQHGSVTNWSTADAKRGGIGGAMDLLSGHGDLIIVMEHTDSKGRPKLRKRCTYPLTGRSCVSYAVTDLAVHGAVLALVPGGELKGSSLPALCAKAGEVLAFDVPKPRDLPTWVRGQFERLGVRSDREAARALVEIVGEDATALATEAEKLAAWAGDEPVGRREVELLAAPAHEASAWAIMDAWGARDLAAALDACQSALEHGEEPFVVAVRLASQVTLVRQAQALAEEGLGAREIAKRLRKHEFRVRKALGHAENYTHDELDDAVVRLAALDGALKGASRLAGELELERALVELVRMPELAIRRSGPS